MKRRDFVKFAALLPVAPAMVAASQIKPQQTLPAPVDESAKQLQTTFLRPHQKATICEGFTFGESRITGEPRITGFWTTFDDVEKQTNFLKGQFGNKENFWLNANSDFNDFNTVSYVKTFTVRGGGIDRDVTKLSFGYMWFCVWTGAKISITASEPSVRIEQINPQTGKALDWKWTRETYKETVIRIATEFDAFNPEWLVPFARADKVPQTTIKNWMWLRKYGPDKFVLRSHFKADVISGIGRRPLS